MRKTRFIAHLVLTGARGNKHAELAIAAKRLPIPAGFPPTRLDRSKRSWLPRGNFTLEARRERSGEVELTSRLLEIDFADGHPHTRTINHLLR